MRDLLFSLRSWITESQSSDIKLPPFTSEIGGLELYTHMSCPVLDRFFGPLCFSFRERYIETSDMVLRDAYGLDDFFPMECE